MEKPIDEIPSESRVRRRRKTGRNSDLNSAPRTTSRPLTATPNTSTIIDLTLSDDDKPDIGRRDAPRRREDFSEGKAVTPSNFGLQPVVPNIESPAGTRSQLNSLAARGKQSVSVPTQPTSHPAQSQPIPRRSANDVEDLEEMPNASPAFQHSQSTYDSQHKEHLPDTYCRESGTERGVGHKSGLCVVSGPLNMAESDSGSGSIVARVDIINRASPDSPIGGRADEREQTTSRRAEAHATLTRRVDNTNQIGKPRPPPGRPEGTHRGAVSRAIQLPFKPRAVKSAGTGSPLRRRPGSERPTHRLAKNHAHPSSSPPVSNKRLPRLHEVGKRPSASSNTNPSDHRRKIGLPEQLNPTDVRPINMGAQISGPTASGPTVSESPPTEAPERMTEVEIPAKELLLSPSETLRVKETGPAAQISPAIAEDSDQRGKSRPQYVEMRAYLVQCKF